jgi:nucleoside-diphosphate-sugar epimerase
MGDTVCVTGAGGYVATQLIKQLLEKGYTVRGTVRSTANASKVKHLERLGEALPGRLELHEADLLQEGTFDKVVSGCKYVFHTASPFFIETPSPQQDLIDPALKGTKNVLGSIVKAKDTVKRVVITSSVAAVHGEYAAPPKSGQLYSEDDWNETSTLDNGQAYHFSKTLAEREAWAIANQHKLDLVTICPNFILGPVLSDRTDGLSVGYLQGWVEGKKYDSAPVICDVRDVARAHVLAVEVPSAAGRYIVSRRETLPPKAVSQVLQARFPQFDISDGPDVATEEKINNSKAEKELGLVLTPWQSTMIDAAVTLIAVGIASPNQKV